MAKILTRCMKLSICQVCGLCREHCVGHSHMRTSAEFREQVHFTPDAPTCAGIYMVPKGDQAPTMTGRIDTKPFWDAGGGGDKRSGKVKRISIADLTANLDAIARQNRATLS